MSFRLPESLAAWETPAFAATLCREIANLPLGTLPLQQALAMGSCVVDKPPQVMLLASRAHGAHLEVKVGVFFNTVVAGCNCADDPGPMAENNEYCELRFHIDRTSGRTLAGIC